ncbi:AraC-like DNA-binding protein [Actimicrobium sp. GrIS 1.19]|uniref:AraC family transcriptional regulator n=1 Tax=Actimicrobium sp. GrIS 1.19 TaxID=3071708 RepID=UPI002E0C26C0|nr:AraC-like DNA-binding protein [Actimicrobium sp. GrIS 1.19]
MGTLHLTTPELEHKRLHDDNPAVLPEDLFGFVRYLEHGSPSALIRWHCHDEYEIHLIVASSGKVFVGDYIGEFAPGNLILTGPRIPHNSVTNDEQASNTPLRDRVIQFGSAPLAAMRTSIPEIEGIFPMLDRSQFGVEFFGLEKRVARHMDQVRDSTGLSRLIHFFELLRELAHCGDYRLLSSVQLKSVGDSEALATISNAVNYILEHYSRHLSITELAHFLGMSETKCSRFFRAATGNCFSEFVSRLRINKACKLLMETDHYISNVCYDVGFNNVANFNRRFLEIKGMTPKAFRQQAQGRFGP